jgi:hypothetical protein
VIFLIVEGLEGTYGRKSPRVTLYLVHFVSLLCPLCVGTNKQQESLPPFFGSRVIFGVPFPICSSSYRSWYGDVNQIYTLYVKGRRGGGVQAKVLPSLQVRVMLPVFQQSTGCPSPLMIMSVHR